MTLSVVDMTRNVDALGAAELAHQVERQAEEAEAKEIERVARERSERAQQARADAYNSVIQAVLRRQSDPILSPADAQMAHVFGEALIGVQSAQAAKLAEGFRTLSSAVDIAKGAAVEEILSGGEK